MIRFYENKPTDNSYMDITILPKSIMLGENVWDEGKELFRKNICCDVASVSMIPIENEDEEIVCYAYQDVEANRELRMLRELEAHKEALQFEDIFPKIKEVVICGCNELAYHFVKYLEEQHVKVSVTGEYWDYFGYEKSIDLKRTDKLVICAESILPRTDDLCRTIIKSASSEFECIDKIYEANVKAGKIKDRIEDFARVLKNLRGKDVVILGTDARAQDAYDLLYQHGIDICYFAKWKCPQSGVGGYKTLLGKKITEISKAICEKKDFIFINCNDRNSALGSRDVEFFDYYGYVRNEQFFLLRDYTDIPCSNLVHVLKGRQVWLAGAEKLCMVLANYLRDVEGGDIDVQYVELSQCMSMKETTVLCIAYPWNGSKSFSSNPKVWCFREELSAMVDLSYTEYFSSTRAFSLIDLYRNRNHEKYSIKQLFPKGILLGRIPPASGNVFFRGVLDGHPNILKWGYNAFNDNLFRYCICLANEKPQDILKSFKKMFNEEYIFQLERNIACWDEFQKGAEPWLSLKNHFSSQELFIIFHIAYAEMTSGMKITDLSDKVIYWEPHNCSRDEFPYLAQWLEDEKINGQTIYMHRDNVVRTGSCYKFFKKNPSTLAIFKYMAGNDFVEEDEVSYQHWTEFYMRFEDIKLHPKTELMKICNKFEIPWSDTMLRTTNDGEAWDYQGVMDFDIKPVFNKYEEYLSVFDRFRISLLCSPYQKMYGYTYESCMKFSRKELQEMFLKKFRFQENLQFENEYDKITYYRCVYELMRWDLWKVRRHEVLEDITPRLEQMDIGQSMSKEESEKKRLKKSASKRPIVKKASPEEVNKLVEFVRRQEKLILYGIEKDCEALLNHLNEKQSELLFCDLIASYKDSTFHGRKVIAPEELLEQYSDYKILVTSSRYHKSIHRQLTELGVSPDRITCNTFQLWEDEK